MTYLALAGGIELSSPHSGGNSDYIPVDEKNYSFLPRIAGVTLGGAAPLSPSHCFLPRIAGVTLIINWINVVSLLFLPRIAGVTPFSESKRCEWKSFLPRIAGVTLSTEDFVTSAQLSSPHSGGHSILRRFIDCQLIFFPT